MARRRVELFSPNTDERELLELQSVFKSGWLGYGPRSQGVEHIWSHEVGARFGVATNSCTSALQIALRLAGIGPGDEVLVPTVTFAATAEAVVSVGATPIFCDVDSKSLLIDLIDASNRIGHKTRAIIPVLYAGQHVDIGNTWKGLKVIYDCAHAGGSGFNASDKLCCWSFQAVKNLGIGDGGMVTTDCQEDAIRGKTLAWHGISRTTWDRANGKHYTWDYDVQEIGIKGQMNDIAAAVLSVQIGKLGESQSIRRSLAYRYRQRLEGIVEFAAHSDNVGWHLFVIKSQHRNRMADYLAEHGIVTGVHYRPLHLHTAFRQSESLPTAERVWPQILSLPIHARMDLSDVDWICDVIEVFQETYGDASCEKQLESGSR